MSSGINPRHGAVGARPISQRIMVDSRLSRRRSGRSRTCRLRPRPRLGLRGCHDGLPRRDRARWTWTWAGAWGNGEEPVRILPMDSSARGFLEKEQIPISTMAFAISLLLFFPAVRIPGLALFLCLRYFWTFELCVALCASVLDWRCAGCCVAHCACCEGSAFALDADQWPIWGVGRLVFSFGEYICREMGLFGYSMCFILEEVWERK